MVELVVDGRRKRMLMLFDNGLSLMLLYSFVRRAQTMPLSTNGGSSRSSRKVASRERPLDGISCCLIEVVAVDRWRGNVAIPDNNGGQQKCGF